VRLTWGRRCPRRIRRLICILLLSAPFLGLNKKISARCTSISPYFALSAARMPQGFYGKYAISKENIPILNSSVSYIKHRCYARSNFSRIYIFKWCENRDVSAVCTDLASRHSSEREKSRQNLKLLCFHGFPFSRFLRSDLPGFY
jgi:hypothetical protein